VATIPTELIVSDGKPKFSPVKGGELLYMSNSDSDVVMEIQSQRYYVLLSGRWFSSKSLGGPWTYVAADKLPRSFANIPPDSDVGHLLTFVAGTDQAKDAVLDNQIPQTTAIVRSKAKLEVTYDGDPVFEKITGTNMFYATNTQYSVISLGSKYYACHQAVWYVADSPMGPWVVADHIPREIYTIPASSPLYNVKYVYIYDYTPEVVYVGYTPGYVYSYVYGPTIVYGTGWYYRPWYRYYYYPRPVTWGFHVRFNPWYGWGFGFRWGVGPFTFSFGRGGWYGRGWWGPGGWRGYRHGYRHGARAGYRAGRRSSHNNRNIYHRGNNRNRNAKVRSPGARPASGRANNVYTDRKGNVYRRSGDNWQKRDGNQWRSAGSGRDRPSGSGRDRSQQGGKTITSQGGGRVSGQAPRAETRTQNYGSRGSYNRSQSSGTRNLDRQHQSRQHGASRTQQYRSSGGRSSGGWSGGGGRSRGGGGGGGRGGRRR
jgi:hypothetical protein